jgi:beta-galactosidase
VTRSSDDDQVSAGWDGDNRGVPPSFQLSRRDFLVAAVAAGAAATSPFAEAAQVHRLDRRDTSFDNGWIFHRGALPGAEAVGYPDSNWRAVDLPHDWSIEDLPDASSDDAGATADPAVWATPAAPPLIGPFDEAAGESSQAFMVGGEGWYRKHFELAGFQHGQELELRMDGVFQNADVWLNGGHIGFHPYGYTPALFDLTRRLRAGTNVVAVRVRNIGSTSRWYSGSGIYRHTWLTVTRAVRVATFGVRINTAELTSALARLHVEVDAENRTEAAAPVTVSVTVLGADARTVARGTANSAALPGGGSTTYTLMIDMLQPSVWAPANPALYTAKIELLQGSTVVDTVVQTFGVRSISMDARGFLLNGTPMKMRGGCVHSQHGALGAASYDAAEERRVRILKDSGFNAVRTAHNPASPAFLDACDRLGMLVYAELFDGWDQAKRADDYHRYFPDWCERDLSSTVARDYNHPSIVIWSTGNEIMEPKARAAELARSIRKLDHSRPVTQSAAMGMADLHDAVLTGDVWEFLDIGDVHYQSSYEKLHKAQPGKAIVQSESWPANFHDNWMDVQTNECAVGDFVWTAWDYLGETGVGATRIVDVGSLALTLREPFPHVEYPWFQSYCGDIDLIGRPKPQNYYRRVVCGDRPLEMAVERPAPPGKEQRAHMWSWFDDLRSWTWDVRPGRVMRVRIYTNCEEVSLALNGNEVATKKLAAVDRCMLVFEVPYAPGILTAVGRNAGKEIARQSLETVGAPASLQLTAEFGGLAADRGGIAHVLVEVVDAKRRPIPDAVVKVDFDVAGEAQIAAVGNANPRNLDSFRRPHRYTYHGEAQVVLRSTGRAGKVRLRASAAGLQPAELIIVAAKRQVV